MNSMARSTATTRARCVCGARIPSPGCTINCRSAPRAPRSAAPSSRTSSSSSWVGRISNGCRPRPARFSLPDPTVVAQIIAAAKAYGYDPGTMGASNAVSKQKTYIAKLDWNINEKQRATFSYRRTDSGTPNFADFNGSTYTSLSNHWYQAKRINDVLQPAAQQPVDAGLPHGGRRAVQQIQRHGHPLWRALRRDLHQRRDRHEPDHGTDQHQRPD